VLPDREAVPRTRLPGTDQLSASARHEVEAMNAAWGGEWERAVTCADKALEQLAGGKEIRRYQALWNYLAGSWAIAGRADHTFDKRLASHIKPDLLILDDFAMREFPQPKPTTFKTGIRCSEPRRRRIAPRPPDQHQPPSVHERPQLPAEQAPEEHHHHQDQTLAAK
jgi:hypothetical protein